MSSNNPFINMSDEEFELTLRALSQDSPIWEECSKEEYEKHCPDIEENLTTENLILAMSNSGLYRKEPIYKGMGICHLIIRGEKPIGYKYYKVVGYEKVLICGAKMAEWINERQKKTPL